MDRAFSLVELSIVLVILGLLTGGILAGQSLIRAAELRSITADANRFTTAIQTFRDKYLAIPGDLSTATRFWGRQVNATHCATNSAAAVTASGTCDGNGDGIMILSGTANESLEAYQLWRQLSLAGLIEGSYSGLVGPGGTIDAVIGVNIPASKISTAGWTTRTLGQFAGNGEIYTMNYGNTFDFGLKNNIWGMTSSPALRPEEAWNIDTKIDDGRPAQGNLIARHWNNACAQADDGSSANNDLAASYRVSDNQILCSLIFRNAY